MKNIKAWKCLVKSLNAASDVVVALGGVGAWDEEFYEQENLRAEQEKVLAFVERLQALHMQYGEAIGGADEDF